MRNNSKASLFLLAFTILMNAFTPFLFAQVSHTSTFKYYLENPWNCYYEVGPTFPGTATEVTSTLNLFLNYNDGTYKKTLLRFQHIGIPAAATIDQATLSFYIRNALYDSPEVYIYGEESTDSDGWIDSSSYISTRAKTEEYILWSGGDVGTGKKYLDVTGIVQEIVDQPGWGDVSGAVSFIVEDVSNTKRLSVYPEQSNNDIYRPSLEVTYTVDDYAYAPEPGWEYTSSVVSSTSDDGWQDASGNIYVSDSLNYINSYDVSPVYSIAIFRDVYIPVGATINDASFVYRSTVSSGRDLELAIENNVSPANLIDNATISGRETGESEIRREFASYDDYLISFDHIGEQIGSLVAQEVWDGTHDIAIIIKDAGQIRREVRMADYSWGIEPPPSLNIAYTIDSEPTPTPTMTPTETPTPTNTPTATPTFTPTPTPNAYMIYRWGSNNYYVPAVPQSRWDSNYKYMAGPYWNGEVLYTPWSPTPPPYEAGMVMRYEGVNYYMIATPVAEN